jgi:uncharacterized protein (UPF0303 family)
MSEELNILKKQEESLEFEYFDHKLAYRLGTFMVEYAEKHDITIAVSIRSNDGSIIFQYLPDGTNLLNQKWMERKFNTVKWMERSSLMTTFAWEENGDTVENHGLNPEDFAICGGGVPIRIKGTKAVIGAVIASNLYHVDDHRFVITCLKEFMGRLDVVEL